MSIPDDVRPHHRRAHAIGCVVAFALTERYAPFRQLVSKPVFTGLLVCLTSALLVAGLLVGSVVGLATPRLFEGLPNALGLGLALLLVLDGYLLLAFAVKQTAGQQVQRITDPPNVALFRAMDLPPLAVYTAYAALPTLVFHLGLVVMNVTALGFLAAGYDGVAGAWWIVLVPLLGLLAISLASAVVTARPRRPRHLVERKHLIAAVLVAAAGLGTGRLVQAVRNAGLPGVEVALLADPPDWVPFAGGLLLLSLGSALVWRLRALDRARFSIVDHTPGTRQKSSATTSSAYQRTAREFWAHRSSAALGAGARTLTLAMVFVLTLVAGGLDIDRELVRQWVIPSTTGYLFVTTLIMVGLTFAVVGPSVLAERQRFEWENSGRTSLAIAGSSLVFHLALVTPPGVAVAFAQLALSGTVSAKPLAITWAMVGAATIGETVIPPRAQVDGTTSPGPLAPLVILLLTAPVLVMGTGPWWSLVHVVYGVVLLGVGTLCLSQRIQRLPSSYSTSSSVTARTVLPSSTA